MLASSVYIASLGVARLPEVEKSLLVSTVEPRIHGSGTSFHSAAALSHQRPLRDLLRVQPKATRGLARKNKQHQGPPLIFDRHARELTMLRAPGDS